MATLICFLCLICVMIGFGIGRNWNALILREPGRIGYMEQRWHFTDDGVDLGHHIYTIHVRELENLGSASRIEIISIDGNSNFKKYIEDGVGKIINHDKIYWISKEEKNDNNT
jgi:hypothetical protein